MLNRCEFIGNLGRDPEVRHTKNGDKVVNFSMAVTEKWKDQSGERQERTTWVPVVTWGKAADIAEKYLRKGSRTYVSGQFTVRKWQDQSGQDRYTTEVVLRSYRGELILLDRVSDGDDTDRNAHANREADRSFERSQGGASFSNDLNDSIPFGPERR